MSSCALLRRPLHAALVLVAASGIAGCGSSMHGSPDLDPARVAREVEADPANPYWRCRQAELHLASKDAAAAEAELRAALGVDPAHAASLSLLSRILYDGGRHEEAVQLLEAAKAAGSFPEELALALALHYDALDRSDVAGDLAASVAQRSPDWAALGSALTFLQLRGDAWRDAEGVARRALDADPRSAANHNNFGITQLYGGKPEAAREAFLKARELDAKLPGPCYNLAIVERFYFFDDESAREWFDRYLELAADDPDGLAEALAVPSGAASGEEGAR